MRQISPLKITGRFDINAVSENSMEHENIGQEQNTLANWRSAATGASGFIAFYSLDSK